MADSGEWPLRLRLPLRWNDFDRYGHLNHAIYHVFLAEGRVALMDSLVGDAMHFVLVRDELDFLGEVSPAEEAVVVTARVAEIGRSSMKLEHQILLEDGTVSAAGSAVVVAWDSDRRAARALTDLERAKLAPGARVAPGQ